MKDAQYYYIDKNGIRNDVDAVAVGLDVNKEKFRLSTRSEKVSFGCDGNMIIEPRCANLLYVEDMQLEDYVK